MHEQIRPFTRVAVFGGVTIDRIATSAHPPVAGASNPGTILSAPGGVGLNIASILARLGLETRLVARVGAAADGEAVIAAAQAAGIDTTAVGVSPASPTARYLATLDDQGNLIIGISDMHVYEEMTPAAVAAAAVGAVDDLWVVDANLPADTLAFLVGEAAVARRPIAAVAVSPAKAVRLAPLLDRLTLVFANRREAAALLKRAWQDKGPAAADLASELSSALTPHVIVTNASDPLAAARRGEVRSLAPLRAQVRSVNGGGDALAAGTIHGLSQGREFFEAVLWGLAAAALTIESDSVPATDFSSRRLAERIAAAGEPAAP